MFVIICELSGSFETKMFTITDKYNYLSSCLLIITQTIRPSFYKWSSTWCKCERAFKTPTENGANVRDVPPTRVCPEALTIHSPIHLPSRFLLLSPSLWFLIHRPVSLVTLSSLLSNNTLYVLNQLALFRLLLKTPLLFKRKTKESNENKIISFYLKTFTLILPSVTNYIRVTYFFNLNLFFCFLF